MRMENKVKLSIFWLILEINKLSSVNVLKLKAFLSTTNIGHFNNNDGNLFVVDWKGGTSWFVRASNEASGSDLPLAQSVCYAT